MRSRAQRVADVAYVTVAVTAGAVVALAPVFPPGLVLGGYACGGGGNAQRCTGIARQLTLVSVSPRAWAYVAGGALCILLGAATLLLARHRAARIALAISILVIAFVGLVQTTRIDVKLGPSGSGSGTYGRTTEDWGAFLSPALIELRQDALRRYEGRRTEPGGPRYDREQILGSFFVRGLDGWRYLHAAVVVLFFAAGLTAVRSVVRRLPLAIVTTSTAGLVVWAVVAERATRATPARPSAPRASSLSSPPRPLRLSGPPTSSASSSVASSTAGPCAGDPSEGPDPASAGRRSLARSLCASGASSLMVLRRINESLTDVYAELIFKHRQDD